MTLDEFKAWFDGFTEDMKAPPTDKQWKRIKARVKEINGSVMTYPVFVKQYPYYSWPYSSLLPLGSLTGASSMAVGQNAVASSDNFTLDGFDAKAALFSLGRADYIELTT